ncbi:MAG: transposase, partial [Nitrososphaera sp.]
ILLFADNAAYQSSRVRKHLRSTNGCVRIIHCPRYAPQLNPIEIQWRKIEEPWKPVLLRYKPDVELFYSADSDR